MVCIFGILSLNFLKLGFSLQVFIYIYIFDCLADTHITHHALLEKAIRAHSKVTNHTVESEDGNSKWRNKSINNTDTCYYV